MRSARAGARSSPWTRSSRADSSAARRPGRSSSARARGGRGATSWSSSPTTDGARPDVAAAVDLLYIDGKHDYWTLSDDLQWTDHLPRCGAVLVHDCLLLDRGDPRAPAPRAAVTDAWPTSGAAVPWRCSEVRAVGSDRVRDPRRAALVGAQRLHQGAAPAAAAPVGAAGRPRLAVRPLLSRLFVLQRAQLGGDEVRKGRCLVAG